MNLPDPAPYATPVAQAFTQICAMVTTFGTTTAEASKALQEWQAQYLSLRDLQQAQKQPAPTSQP